MTEIKGWHVLSAFVFAFGIIISVNLTLAFNAVRTFPGLEVKNSYVASQAFEKNRKAQTSLNWNVKAWIQDSELVLQILQDGNAVEPEIQSAIFGRATNVSQDQTPRFNFDGETFRAPVTTGDGNWNLRLVAIADDGTHFAQRVIVEVRE